MLIQLTDMIELKLDCNGHTIKILKPSPRELSILNSTLESLSSHTLHFTYSEIAENSDEI